MSKFKICGLRDLKNVVLASNCGAEMLGFVFVSGVRREISVQTARKIIREYRELVGSNGADLVGLFANQSVNFVNEVVETCGLDYVQLCGEESPEYWDKVNGGVIRQVKVPIGQDLEVTISKTLSEVDVVLESGAIPILDRKEKGHLGGTGKSFNWDVAANIPDGNKFILAGGLTPSNVAEAIDVANPWMVDVSTGVETEGEKDQYKIKIFSSAVKAIGN